MSPTKQMDFLLKSCQQFQKLMTAKLFDSAVLLSKNVSDQNKIWNKEESFVIVIYSKPPWFIQEFWAHRFLNLILDHPDLQ